MLSFAITNGVRLKMHKSKLWMVWALGMAVGPLGCMMDGSEEPVDTGDDDEEDLGVAQQAINTQPGSRRCNDTEVAVHPTTPAGNMVIIRNSAGTTLQSYGIACSSMGLAMINGGYGYEVVANNALAAFSSGKPSCGSCLAFQGGGGANPPGGGGSVSYSSRVSYPTNIVSIGTRGTTPAGGYYFGNNAFMAATHPTSFCDLASPDWGRLTNAWGYQLISTGSGSAWGTNAYEMWDPTTSTIRAASVNSLGILAYVPFFDACQ